MTGYIRTVRKNSIAPQRDIGMGTEPLTVIEFSLTNEIRYSLKKALERYVKAGDIDMNCLGEIIKAHFPPEVLNELKSVHKEYGSPSTIYIVKNLPEVEPEKIPKFPPGRDRKSKMSNWQLTHSYAYYIGKGMSEALGFGKQHGCYPHSRYSNNDVRVEGDALHKHHTTAGMIQGIFGDNAVTRFTDWQTVLEEAEANLDSGNIMVGTRSDPPIRLADFAQKYSKWHKPWAVSLNLAKMDNYADNYDDLIKRHSLDIIVERGDLVLWSNEGRLYHQAFPGPKQKDNTDELLRATIAWNISRPR